MGEEVKDVMIKHPDDYEYNRASGRTTRLIDKYIQELFAKEGEWIEIKDHYDNRHAHKYVFNKVLDRMHLEHTRISLASNRTKSIIKINK